MEGVFAATERLELFPHSGRVVQELEREEIREVFYRRHRIIYEVKPDHVEVLTVRHLRQLLQPGNVEE